MVDCNECTLSQSAQIQYIVHSLHPGIQYAIAIQNNVETMSFLSTVENSIQYQWDTITSPHTPILVEHFHQPQLPLKWLSTEAEQNLENYKFPTFPGYNQHAYIVFTSKDKTKSYMFVKYMDNNITTSSEYYPYLKFQSNDWLRFEYNDKYYDAHNFSCPQKIHNPKCFSWTEAKIFCYEYGDGILPEFVDRYQEEEFISLLHKCGSDIFPLDAVFVGLQFALRKVGGNEGLFLSFTSVIGLQIERSYPMDHKLCGV